MKSLCRLACAALVGSGLLKSQPAKQYALLIGNARYLYVTPLRTATEDARAVEAVLHNSYGFETRLMQDATRAQILSALSSYRRLLGPDSSLLIYYAGHGFLDDAVEKAYWWPIDARQDNPSEWISADDIVTSVKGMSARHVLIVSDSCFSGALARAGVGFHSSALNSERDTTLARLDQRMSREVLASGGREPVADGGDGNHSVFAGAFLRGLQRVTYSRFAVEELFQDVRESVAGRSAQIPEFDPVRNSGHDGGSFIFTRSGTPVPAVSSNPATLPVPTTTRAPGNIPPAIFAPIPSSSSTLLAEAARALPAAAYDFRPTPDAPTFRGLMNAAGRFQYQNPTDIPSELLGEMMVYLQLKGLTRQPSGDLVAIVAAAQIMPDDAYRFQPSPSAPTFAELVARGVRNTSTACAAKTPLPANGSWTKDVLMPRLSTTLADCRSITVDMPSQIYGQMRVYLQLKGIAAPPSLAR